MEEQGRAKKVCRRRDFTGATALDTSMHYCVQWNDFEECLALLLEKRKWLLITGPFQSGKSSLAYALADRAAQSNYIAAVTTLTTDMVDVANDSTLTDVEASDRFFGLLAEALETDSGQALKRIPPSSSTAPGGMIQVMRMLQKVLKKVDRKGEPDVVWFVDEAALLNEVVRVNIVRTFLSGLRTLKEKSRTGSGYRLRSFSLVGTAKMQKLLSSAKLERLEVVARPSRRHNPYNPFPLGNPVSLSLERCRDLELLREEDILGMLREYGRDHGVTFSIVPEGIGENEQALSKLATSVYELTSGYKGLVGSCCEYIQGNGIRSLERWRRDARDGSLAEHVLNFRVYSRIVSNIPMYSEELRQRILDCVLSPTSGVAYESERDMDMVLPAINDGVLRVDPGGTSISISSGLLLAAILEGCRQACTEEVGQVDTFDKAVRASFRYMKPSRLLLEDLLSSNGQPSEYIWQSEFLLGLKFVLENSYSNCKYVTRVECKRKEKNCRRSIRVDFCLSGAGCPVTAFEVQGKGDGQSVARHIARAEKYRLLFAGCDMNYVYFTVGDDDEAKAAIERESKTFNQVKCWFVQLLAVENVWNVEELRDDLWHSVRMSVPPSFPKFRFATRAS